MDKSISVRSRITRTMQAGVFGQVVTVTSQLASVPLFLHFWGVERFGEWIIISAIPAYLALSDMGFASAAANDMTMARAKGDMASVVLTYRSALLLLCIVSIALATLSPLFGWLIASGDIVEVSSVSEQGLILVFEALGVGVGLTLITGLVGAAYRCEGTYHLAVLFSNLTRLAELIVTVICVVCGGEMLALAALIVATRFAGLLLTCAHVTSTYKWAKPSLENANWIVIRRLARPAVSFMAFPLGYAITLQGFALLIGAYLGASAVVAFTTMRTLARVAGQAVGVIAVAIWPEMSAAFGRNDVALARDIHRKAFQATLIAASISILGLGILGEEILRIWTNGAVSIRQDTYFVLLAGLALNALWLTSSVVATAKNLHQSISVYFLASSAAGLALGMVATRYFGMTGAASAALFVECVMTVIVLPRALSLTDDSRGQFISSLKRFSVRYKGWQK